MCQKCIDAVKKFWPDLPENQYSDLLWNITCFPFGDHNDVLSQVKEMAEKSGCNLDKAMAIANEQTKRAMSEITDGH